MTPSNQERIDRLRDHIIRCDRHYDEPEKYPPMDTMRVINQLTWRQFKIVGGGAV